MTPVDRESRAVPCPPLVLCPGLDGTGDAFDPLWDRAVARQVPVEIVRYADLGPEACTTVDDYVDTIQLHRRDPAGLGAGTPHLLVAESFSGPLAMRAAAADPPLGLVLVATFRRRPRRWPAWLLRMAGPLVGLAPPPKWAIRTFMTGPADTSLLEALQQAMGKASDHVAPRLAMVAEHDARFALRDIQAPILMLTGARDRLVTPADTEDLVALRPDATVRTLDAAHLVLQTAPDAALDAIQQWWSGFISDSHERPTRFADGGEKKDVH